LIVVPDGAKASQGKSWHLYVKDKGKNEPLQQIGSKRLLGDFIVGAHALLQADRLMTFDPKRYKSHFPELKLL
jgi:predicted nucleic acid-binding protein